jgi:hypothetical protein
MLLLTLRYGQRYVDVVLPINMGQIHYSDVLSVIDAGRVGSNPRQVFCELSSNMGVVESYYCATAHCS